MIRLAENANRRDTVGIAIENPMIGAAVSRILTGMGNYEIAVFDELDVAGGAWPDASCRAVVTSPEAFDTRNEVRRSRPHGRPVVILALKRKALPCQRDNLALADSFVLMDETLPRLPSLVLLSRYGLSIMPRLAPGSEIVASPRLNRMKTLSGRDALVLRELGQGKGNHAIAAALGISVPMAKVHIRRIIARLGFRNRTDAAVFGALWFAAAKPRASYPIGRSRGAKGVGTTTFA